MPRSTTHHILQILLLVTLGCTDRGTPVSPLPPEISAADLRGATESIEVAGRSLTLSTYLWRDFMPTIPSQDHPLRGVFTVTASDTAKLPADVSADAVWLVLGNEVWRGWLETVHAPPGELKPNQLRYAIARGPDWEPDLTVDAVIRLNAPSGGACLLRAASQTIHRTD